MGQRSNHSISRSNIDNWRNKREKSGVKKRKGKKEKTITWHEKLKTAYPLLTTITWKKIKDK